ncbi:hypothetical protein [Caulobacter sp. FWC26]|jgi:hypothetical protein|uniref:hypothetical protein n=1 Tax=Caulobacter sp. FWC26 TaxID=69665 RepID=UPI000C15807C|nr:hypothetical protein [Caulobacter sp. FWC26]AZS21594.1 hypothetical protein CSW63_13650 [Caulobacter sp. FWC26]
MVETPKPLDEVDWAEAAEHLVGMFPGASLGQVVARAEAAAVTLDQMGMTREAESMRRAAAYVRRHRMN